MRRIGELSARHQWLSFVCAWLLATGVVLLVFPGKSPLATLLRVALYSAGGVWMAVRRRRREKAAAGGSADDLVTLNRMIRQGEVPTEPARRASMRTLVDQRLHRARHRMAALVFMGLLLAAVAAATFATTTAPRALLSCFFCAAFFAYLALVGGAATRRLHRMRASLDGSSRGTDPTAVADHASPDHATRHATRHAA